MISLRSKITRKLLNYLYVNPQEKLYVNELCRKLGLDKRNFIKKAGELEKEGILKYETRGNLKLYSINKKYALYNEYRKIVFKTEGIEKKLAELLKETKGVKEAYIYGSYAHNTLSANSDIDLLVIGSHKIIDLQRKLVNLQREIEREINVVNIGEKEFKEKLRAKDPFYYGVMKRKYIKLL